MVRLPAEPARVQSTSHDRCLENQLGSKTRPRAKPPDSDSSLNDGYRAHRAIFGVRPVTRRARDTRAPVCATKGTSPSMARPATVGPAAVAPSRYVTGSLPDVSHDVSRDGGRIRLPFDLSEVITNLRHERYCQNRPASLQDITVGNGSRNLYYFMRPILPVAVRKHLQRVRLSGWDRIAFPRWPVDSPWTP